MKKIPWGISEGESFGASVHNALKKWGELEQGLGVGLGNRRKKCEVREDQLGLFIPEERSQTGVLTEEKLLDLWHQSFVFDTYATRFEADFARRRGEELLRRFYAWWSASLHKVMGVEKGFSVEIDSLVVTGRLDRIEECDGGVKIVDFKTTAPCTQQEADADLQLSLYALAAEHLFDRPCKELVLLFLSDEGVVERSTMRSASQLKDARTQIRLIRERLLAKDYRPTPSVSTCKRCPYRGVCDVSAA